MRLRPMIAVLVGWALLAAVAPAAAHSNNNHGTIKVHDDQVVDPPTRNDPHVTCDFWIQGFDMSGGSGTIVFEQIPPTSNPKVEVLTAPWTADSGNAQDGFDFTEGPFNFTTVPGLGHYRVEVFVDNGGPPGNQDHSAKSKVFWADPCSANGPPPPPPPPPDCPDDLTATALSNGDIFLDWDAVGGASSYLVYRGTDAGALDFLATTTQTQYTDDDTVVGVTYHYQVTAIVDDVESEDCDLVRATAIPFFDSAAGLALATVGGLGAFALMRRRP